MTADILREKFLNFFKARKHHVVESDSLVPKDDPTVLFTPAGMNQFKKEFLGMLADFSRAATSQRCLRTDDLEKVGKTAVHHTFFEMLGNFSFGDYFKKEAIQWAWEFLTDELKIDEDKLWVSVYKDDDEAYKIWKDIIKVSVKKIIKLGDKDNFWPAEAKQKGPNGPCGPCSEIFYDFGADAGCGKENCTPACDCGRFAEVWNLVFTQFNRKEGGALEPLPNKNIDTGMGLERLAAVMQGKKNNFETDLFQSIVKEILANVRGNPQIGFVYAVADHIRAVTFAIFDGVMPSNEARGYVIRKIIRKSVLHLRALGIEKPFLYKLVPVVAEVMLKPYPELQGRRENIAEIILSEEKNFISILNSSKELIEKGLSELVRKTKNKDFSENDIEKASIIAFELYDTYGIPWGLTKDWADIHGIKIDKDVFNLELEKQKNRSKSKSNMKGDVFSVKELDLGVKGTKFVGYTLNETKAKILKIIKDGKEANKLSAGEEGVIVLDKTPLYAESGGQLADTGELIKGKNKFKVSDTQKSGKVILHAGKLSTGVLRKNDSVLAKVDLERRMNIARNHTATHLLQAALRKVLGAHVKQQGSLVAPDRLRFDFTHFKNISSEELRRIEEVVNDYILENHSLSVKEMPLALAKKTGALAFFGEKYSGKVRVVAVEEFSKEFCGGTHLKATGQTGLFKIISEGSVASGVRRIEAVTGKAAYNIIKEEEAIARHVSEALNVSCDRVAQEVNKRLNRIKELEKQLSSQKLDQTRNSLDSLIESAAVIKDVKLITEIMENADMNLLRKTIDMLKEKTQNCVIALGTDISGRALLVLGITGDLCQRGLDASKIVPEIAKVIGGSGGGRKDFAQAGGTNPDNFAKAFAELKNIIGKML